jgi:hypothetical protein
MTLAKDPKTSAQESQSAKKPWVRPTLNYTGQITEIIRAGGGKLSPAGGDPGESRKQRSEG